jgi:hypothetical protein
MGPNFSNIKDIKAVVLGVLFWHGLNIPVPAWIISCCNSIIKIVSSPFRVLETLSGGFSCCEILDSLSGFVVVLDIVNFALIIHPFEGVRRVTIHVAVTIRSTTVTEQDSDLMKSFRGVAPEIESRVRVLEVVNWVAFLGVDEVWELDWILDEENWGVVADHIVITLLSVMLNRESTGITVAVVCTTLTSNS